MEKSSTEYFAMRKTVLIFRVLFRAREWVASFEERAANENDDTVVIFKL